LFCTFLLVNYLFNPNAWFNFKKKNVLHYLGKISYGLYMYHNIVFYFLFNEVIYKYQLLSVFWFWPIYLLTVFGLSVLSYELFEKHFLKLKDRFAVVQTRR
jgi:peptidoglycan/LPS O-acetylase OafA/YrhL